MQVSRDLLSFDGAIMPIRCSKFERLCVAVQADRKIQFPPPPHGPNHDWLSSSGGAAGGLEEPATVRRSQFSILGMVTKIRMDIPVGFMEEQNPRLDLKISNMGNCGAALDHSGA